MIGRVLFAALLIAATFIQATVLPVWWPLEVQPNVALVLLVVWTGLNGIPAGIVLAAILGVTLDLLTLAPLGMNGLALLSAVLIAGLARQRVLRSTLMIPLILTVIAAIVQPFVLAVLAGLLGTGEVPGRATLPVLVTQAFLCAVFVPPLFLIASWFARRFPEVSR
ncbi:MAG TPA: rod shape-determining protein MreD [Thermomicrobiales bacterium]|jgi:rod shape-determining protein MreD|nr:rod shape-determining protein MreD [Thermomicrobiales bacterium]